MGRAGKSPRKKRRSRPGFLGWGAWSRQLTPSTPLLEEFPDEPADNEIASFDYVFVLPVPTAITEAEEQAFRKKFLTGGKSYADVLEHIAISPKLRPQVRFDDCTSLSDSCAHGAEILLSLFASLGTSLGGEIEVFKFLSEDGTQLSICVRMDDTVAEALADLCSYPVQLAEPALDLLHIKISDQRDLMPAYVNYGSYMMYGDWLKMHRAPGTKSFLRPVDRIRLLYNKVTDYIDLAEMMRTGLLLSAYPVHSSLELERLTRSWANFALTMSSWQPIDEIRNYLGEGLAFYFLFLGFLVKNLMALVVPALVCSAIWWFGRGDIAQAIFCFFQLAWSTCLVKFWRRTEAFYANKWGTAMHGLVRMVKEPVNPRFHGELKPSILDENIMELQPERWKVIVGYTCSATISIIFTTLVAASVGVNQWFAAEMDAEGYSMATEIAAVALSVQIQFWDKLWDYLLVQVCNDMEQHVTQYAADQSRVAKTFVIKFFNAFLAFFYMGYLQPTLDPKGCEGDCHDYLCLNLLIVFALYITFGVMDMGLPYARFKFSIWLEDRAAAKAGKTVFTLSYLEVQSKMSPYTGQDERDDYLSIVCPIAFVMLFGTVMPTMVVLCLIALASQIRTHAWKLVSVLRRPFPQAASGIGVWDKILTVLSYMAILNSIGLLVVQVPDIGYMIPGFRTLVHALGIEMKSTTARTLLFFILQNSAFVCKLTFDALVSDTTAKTNLERSRAMLQRARMAERKHEKHEEVQLSGAAGATAAELAQLPCLTPGSAHYEPASL